MILFYIKFYIISIFEPIYNKENIDKIPNVMSSEYRENVDRENACDLVNYYLESFV